MQILSHIIHVQPIACIFSIFVFRRLRQRQLKDNDNSKTFPDFLELTKTLFLRVRIVQNYSIRIFTIATSSCRNKTPRTAIVTGVDDREFASILPLWATYNVPLHSKTLGEDPEHRGRKAPLRAVFALAVVQACPDAVIVAVPVDELTEQSIHGLHLSVCVCAVTPNIALYSSFEDVRSQLVKIREYVRISNGQWNAFGIRIPFR